jgi:hypothetical protein
MNNDTGDRLLVMVRVFGGGWSSWVRGRCVRSLWLCSCMESFVWGMRCGVVVLAQGGKKDEAGQVNEVKRDDGTNSIASLELSVPMATKIQVAAALALLYHSSHSSSPARTHPLPLVLTSHGGVCIWVLMPCMQRPASHMPGSKAFPPFTACGRSLFALNTHRQL